MKQGDGDPRHGTRNGYGNLKCRCSECREAQRIVMKVYRNVPGKKEMVRQARYRRSRQKRTDRHTARCPECGWWFGAQGLSIHLRRTHDIAPTPVPYVSRKNLPGFMNTSVFSSHVGVTREAVRLWVRAGMIPAGTDLSGQPAWHPNQIGIINTARKLRPHITEFIPMVNAGCDVHRLRSDPTYRDYDEETNYLVTRIGYANAAGRAYLHDVFDVIGGK